MSCDHKFIGSNTCAKCGAHVDALRAADAADWAAFRDDEQRASLEAAARKHGPPAPSPQQLMELGNRLTGLREKMDQLGLVSFYGVTIEDIAVLAWTVGMAHGTLELPRRRDRPRPDDDPEVTWTEHSLHQALDTLLAEYVLDNPRALPSKTSVMDLLIWSNARVERRKAGGS